MAVGGGARSLLLLALLAGTPGVASAHGRLKRSTPAAGAYLDAAPRELRLEFSEVPDLTFSSVTLIAPDGRELALGPLAYATESRRIVIARILAPLRAGPYTVRWQLAGDDGHPVRGHFGFAVARNAVGAVSDPTTAAGGVSPGSAVTAGPHTGPAPATPAPAAPAEPNAFGAESAGYVIVRWVQFAALLLAIGVVAFRQLVLHSGRLDHFREASLVADAERHAARLGVVAVGGLFLTLLVRLFAQSYAMHGPAHQWEISLAGQMIGRTVWGRGWMMQLLGIACAGFGLRQAASSLRAQERGSTTTGGTGGGWNLATAGVVILAYSPALSGHAVAAPSLRALAVAADGAHVLGASGWLGSLAVVLIAGVPAAFRLVESQRSAAFAALINAYSPVALACAGLAGATGLVAAWLHVGAIPNLWGTRYGVTLLVKLAVLSLVALTGLYNWRVARPRLGTVAATTHVRRSAWLELGIALLVLLVTAVLVATPTSIEANG